MKVSSLIRVLPLFAAPAALAQTTIVHDVFADGDRTTQNIAGNSMAWYFSRSQTATADTSGVAFGSSASTSSDGYFGYFADAPVVLAVGDKLQFTLKFQFSGLAAGTSLRFGLLDSGGGARQTADLTGGNSAAAWQSDNGYGLYTNLAGPTGSAATNLNVVERTTLTASNIFNTGTDWTSLSSNSNVNITLADSTVYTLSYSIERTSATDTLLIAGLSGGSIPGGWSRSVTDTSTSATQFDWFDFRVGRADATAWSSIKFTELDVTVTSAIPEPSTYALLLGAGTVAFAGVRRWRQSAARRA